MPKIGDIAWPVGREVAPLALLVAAVAVASIVFAVVEEAVLGRDILGGWGPGSGAYAVVKGLVGLVAGLAIAFVARPLELSAPPAAARPAAAPWTAAILASAALSASVGVLLIADVGLLNRLSLEDGPVENMTALFLVVASGCFLAATWRLFRGDTPDRRAAVLLGLAGAGVTFLFAMEEISWGQRIIGFDTPDLLAANMQGEANLHNLWTSMAEIILALGTISVLVLPPMVGLRRRFDGAWPGLASLMPDGRVALVALPVAGCILSRISLLPYPVVYWALCGWILLRLLARPRTNDPAFRIGAPAILFSLLFTEFMLLTLGQTMIRSWDHTEFRELIIAAGWLALGVLAVTGAAGRDRKGAGTC